jgi:hypothetical protein
MNNVQLRENKRIKDLQHISFKNDYASVSDAEIKNLMVKNNIDYFGAIDIENQLQLSRIYGITINYNINTQKFDLNII